MKQKDSFYYDVCHISHSDKYNDYILVYLYSIHLKHWYIVLWSTTLNRTHNSRKIVFSLYYIERQRIICYI